MERMTVREHEKIIFQFTIHAIVWGKEIFGDEETPNFGSAEIVI